MNNLAIKFLFINYLAHAYLSFNMPEILVGNLISDFVKGKKKLGYPAGIQKGIALHRAIDTFTDNHEVTREAKEIFRPHYRLYAGAFVDVVYDHFLANDETEFSETSLFDFSQQVYTVMDHFTEIVPEKFGRMYPYMKSQNWLFNYRNRGGTAKSLGGVVRRSLYLSESETAFRLFEENYHRLQLLYQYFWSGIKPYARQQLDILI